jgi:crotonobetainyl-CoA:carnitine CoA-transferase CaiB-like acyl-CoA transferase
MLPRRGEHSMWWKVIQRGKRVVTLDISSARGRELALDLARQVDVICENFRPGTLERWGLGPEDLEAEGISVVMLRISGFGQSGPESRRPGFGTIAEAFSGFAHLNGDSDGPPMFPSTTLADGVAATFGAFGIMAALYNRAHSKPASGVEVVDVALFEGLFRVIPTQIAGYDQLGVVPMRPGNKLTSHGVLRNLYRSRDGRWFVISAVGPVPIRRILAAMENEPFMARIDMGVMVGDPAQVVVFLDECDDLVHAWAAKRDYAEIERVMSASDVVFQPVYAADDIVRDPHFQARGDIIDVADEALGSIKMQGVVPKFPRRTHSVGRAGPARGEDNAEVYGQLLGLDEVALKQLHDDGVV